MFQEPQTTGCMGFFSGCGSNKPKTVVTGQRNVSHHNGTTTREVELLEDTLAAQMSNLSFQERTKAMDDLHCVGESLEENEETRRRALAEFDQMVKATKNRSYDLAERQDKGFVEDESFRLKFLRTNLYDSKKAVPQMMKFLHFKERYFGEDTVAREIELSDLTEEEVALLRSGVVFVSKHKDRAGRLVIFFLSHILSTCAAESLIRVDFFFFYNLLASLPEVQMKGFSAIYYDLSKRGQEFNNPGFQAQLQIMTELNCMPFRCTSLHLCIKPAQGNFWLNNAIIRIVLNSGLNSILVRTRLHIGSDMEIQYILQGHGISLETCGPVDSSGAVRQEVLDTWYDDHVEYMKSRGLSVDHLVHSKSPPSAIVSTTIMEEGLETLNSHTMVDIRATDVLLGRGRGLQDHPGNVRFRNALDDYREYYDTAPRSQKRRITMELRQMLAANGVRFLKQVDGMIWVESDTKAAEEKIAQHFRTVRKKKDAMRSFQLILD